jgi:hypothetical protein
VAQSETVHTKVREEFTKSEQMVCCPRQILFANSLLSLGGTWKGLHPLIP